jgi:hypothetical protein
VHVFDVRERLIDDNRGYKASFLALLSGSRSASKTTGLGTASSGLSRGSCATDCRDFIAPGMWLSERAVSYARGASAAEEAL